MYRFLIIFISTVCIYKHLLAGEGSVCSGYGKKLCMIVKKKHELGFNSSFFIFNYSNGLIANFDLGLEYHYNINSYLSFITDLRAGYHSINLSNGNEISIGSETVSTLHQLDVGIFTGLRVYPARNWFYLGTGLGFEYFGIMNSNVRDAHGKGVFSDKIDSYVPLYYIESGLSIPTQNFIWGLGIRLRGNLLGPTANEKMTLPSDLKHYAGYQIIMSFRFPLGVPLNKSHTSVYSQKKEKFYFDIGVSDISFSMKARLDDLAKHFSQFGYSKIIVIGHSDYLGSSSLKAYISVQRAKNITDYLVQLGIPNSVITTYGSSDYHKQSANEHGKNRLAEVVLV